MHRLSHIVKEGNKGFLVEVIVKCKVDVSESRTRGLRVHSKHDRWVPRKVVAIWRATLGAERERAVAATWRPQLLSSCLRRWRSGHPFQRRPKSPHLEEGHRPPARARWNQGWQGPQHRVCHRLQVPSIDSVNDANQRKALFYYEHDVIHHRVKLVVGGREHKNNWPLETIFRAHGRAPDLQEIGYELLVLGTKSSKSMSIIHTTCMYDTLYENFSFCITSSLIYL